VRRPASQAAVGLVHPDRGISMRFPRFIQLRIDKSPEDASSPELIAEMYGRQTRRVQAAG
jgi:DNA ligase 1